MENSRKNRIENGRVQRIHKLPNVIIDRIAAGEVVDGPYSVVKELVENSLDAGAQKIAITTSGGGFGSIVIEDDGDGISYEDLPASVDRHATSKITDLHDIEEILTFGFRGEALASISAVSYLEIRTRNRNEEVGGILESRGGEVVKVEPFSFNRGTTITVKDLFYSVPARRKFARTERIENSRISLQITKIALAYDDVGFKYMRDGKVILDLPSGESLPERISRIYKIADAGKKLVPVDAESGGLHVHGYISHPGFHKSNREGQFFYVNGRNVEFKNLPFLIKRIYADQIPPGTHPYIFLFVTADPRRIDVNVHPAKKEIRFLDEQLFQALVFRSISEALKLNQPLTFENIAQSKDSSSELTMRMDYSNGRYSHKTDREAVDLFVNEKSNFLSTLPIGGAIHNISSGKREDENRSLNTNFLPRRHFGVLFGTYILAEGDDGLYIIDQHTAHERINYERIRREIQSRSGESQTLLHPILVNAAVDEVAEIIANVSLLEKHGFVVDAIAESSYVVRAVPFFVEPGAEEDLISSLVQRILDGEDDFKLYDEFAAMKACKASIKRNDMVSGEIISEILFELSRTENPSRCPHGRPTMIRITRDELDKMFRR